MSVWEDVVGQESAVAAFTAAAQAAREAAEQREAQTAAGRAPEGARDGGAGSVAAGAAGLAMTHAWLVTGPPGSGRSNAARAFAAALQCTGPVPGCGQCKPCRDVLAGSHPDVVRLATEKLIITMEEVKALIGEAQRRPWTGRWRVILVEDADRMAERTTNVLLKSIEEPPPQTVWLLCTPSADDVLPTIRSRCRLVTLRIPPADAVAELLVRRDGADPELAAASLVEAAESEAKEATAERDAREKAELTRALGLESDGKIPAALRAQIRQLEEDQKRRAKRARTDVLDRAMIDLLSFYRDVLTTQMGSDVERVNLDLSDAVDQAARTTSPEQSLARIAAIEECRSRLRSNAAPLLAVEALMVQLRPQAEGR